MKTTKLMTKAVLAAVVAMSMAGAAQAQDMTGILMRMALNVGAKVVERGVASAMQAAKDAAAPKKPQDEAAGSGEAEVKPEAAATADKQGDGKEQATVPAAGGTTKVVLDGVEVEVPTQLLALATPGADKSASMDALKGAMAGAISEQAKADRAVVLKEQTSGIPLVGQVMAPMMVPTKMAMGGAGGLMKMLALASAVSKANAAAGRKPVEIAAGNGDAAKAAREAVSNASKESVKAASDKEGAQPEPKQEKQEVSGSDAENTKTSGEEKKSGA